MQHRLFNKFQKKKKKINETFSDLVRYMATFLLDSII